MRPRLILFCLILAMIIPSAVQADELADLEKSVQDRKTKIQDLQRQIDQLKKSLQNKQTEKVSLKNQLSIINGRLEKTQLDIQSTKINLQENELILKQTQLTIAAKEQEITEEQAQVGELIRALDHSERQTLVSMFASGKTLSDFFVAQDSYTNVDSELTNAMIRIMIDKQALTVQKSKLEDAKRQLETTKDSLVNKGEQLSNQSTSKSQLLAQTQLSEDKFQKLVSDLKRQYASTENEIGAYERKIRAKLKSKNITIPTGAVALRWPVPSHVVTSRYHDPDYPFRHVFEHPGIDIRAGQGTPVRAAGPGIVARAKNAGMGYNYIILIHNNRITTLYGHISRLMVSEDEAVAAGDIIGYSGGMPGTPGAGPFVTGPHLHFEVRDQGIPVNPLEYIQ